MERGRSPFARRTMLLLGVVALGVAAKVALFDIARRPAEGGDVALFLIALVLGVLWVTAGLRAPHPLRDGSEPDPAIPASRVPRWRRPPDPMPVGAWIAIAVLTLWVGLGALFVIASFASAFTPWVVIGFGAALLALHLWRNRRPRRRTPMARWPVGAFVLVPLLVVASLACVAFLVTAIWSWVAG